MTELRKVFKDLLSIGVLFIFLYNIVWVFANAFYGDVGPGLFLLVVPFVLMYVVRRIARLGYVFLLLSGLLFVAFWFFLRFLGADLAVIVFLTLGMVYSVYAWMNSEFEPSFTSSLLFLIFHILLFFIVTDESYYVAANQARVAFSYLVIVCFTVFYLQMDRLDYKLYLVRSLEGQTMSTKRLIRANNTLGLVFAGLVLVMGVLSAFFPLHLIGRFFSWAFSLLQGRFVDTVDLGVMFEDFLLPEGGYAEWDAEEYFEDRTPDFGIVWTILGIIAWLFVITIIFLLLHSIITKVKKRRKSEKLDDAQEEIGISGSLFDDLMDLLPRFKKFRHHLRRAYEKKVNSHIKQGIIIEDYDTTEAIADKIRDSENIDELTAKYDAVRYGREA